MTTEYHRYPTRSSMKFCIV
ncbi:hypothetical protein LINPERHAP1_LOCUS5361 [Linum perenne]